MHRLLLACALLFTFAAAQESARYALPQGTYTIQPDSLLIHTSNFSDTYIFGFGWASGADHGQPTVEGGVAYVDARLWAEIGLAVPAVPAPAPAPQRPVASLTTPVPIDALRFGGNDVVRVVLDVPALPGGGYLENFGTSGRLAEGELLELDLPFLLAPSGSHAPYRGVRASFVPRADGSLLRLDPPWGVWAFNVFALSDPARLVVDLTPIEAGVTPPAANGAAGANGTVGPMALPPEQVDFIAPGVTYRRFTFPGGDGTSPVHLIEVAPGAGEFRVVGESREARTLTELAGGALVAINAGYFNTTTFESIGLLTVDHDMQTLPALGRASIGFNGGSIGIDRVSASAVFSLPGFVRLEAPLGQGGVTVNENAGQRAGSFTQGVITVVDNRVTANRIGPLTVPVGGYAVAYNPELRELALLDPGDVIGLEVRIDPPFFGGARYAVEAGPLLVHGGVAAFEPEREQFQRGIRILDDVTAQAAVGVRPDGTMLLVVAERMRAEDLVSLFLSLGAEQAMRLDSGGSAALYADGSLVNRAVQRRIVSAIVLMPN